MKKHFYTISAFLMGALLASDIAPALAAQEGAGSTTTSSGGIASAIASGNPNAMARSNATLNSAEPTSNNNVPGWGEENHYWRSQYSSRPYYNGHKNYSTYEPAYRYGVAAYTQSGGKPYENLDQTQLRTDWEGARGTSDLSWEQAQPAMRDAYERMYTRHTTTVTH